MSSDDCSVGSSVDDRAYKIIVEDAQSKQRSKRQLLQDDEEKNVKGGGSSKSMMSSSSIIVTPGAQPSMASSCGNSFKEELVEDANNSVVLKPSHDNEDANSNLDSTINHGVLLGAHKMPVITSDEARQGQRLSDDYKVRDSSGTRFRRSDKSRDRGDRSSDNEDLDATNNVNPVEAKLVDGDGHSEEMNLKNLALQEENERLRQQLEVPTAMVQTATESKDASESPDGQNSKKNTVIIVVVVAVLVLIGAGVGAYYAIQSETDDSNYSTATATMIPTPTDAPTKMDLLSFDPLIEDDCLAIQRLDPVSGQDGMPVQTFVVELEVSLVFSNDAITMDSVVETIVQSTREQIVPVLVGCKDKDERRKRRRLTSSSSSWQRNLVNEYRFAIANTKVAGRAVGLPCKGGTTATCHTIGLELDLYLKSSEVRDFKIIPILDYVFENDSGEENDDNTLVDRLGLSNSSYSYFQTIQATTIARARPEVPSSSCTGAEDTCQFASGPIGSDSCTGANRTCWNSQATIGYGACNQGGCTGLVGEAGNGSCNGAGACSAENRIVKIGTGSCNCDGCCACLTQPYAKFHAVFVPPRSCNSLAPNETAIDYDLGKLTPTDDLPLYCCAASS